MVDTYSTTFKDLAGTGVTDWAQFANTQIIVSTTGTATAITGIVERSATNPTSPAGASAAPADSTGITGNPSTGLNPLVYQETGIGWWRVRVTALTGAAVRIALTGASGPAGPN